MRRQGRPAIAALILAAVAALLFGHAQASAAGLKLFAPKPVAPVIAAVAEPSAVDPPDGIARGTAILVHAGGWAGHDAHARDLISETPGDILRKRGWRTVSIDYEEGTEGLQDILRAVRAEIVRRTTAGPLCIYGESSGGHLGLVAASQLRDVDCVISFGSPTDLTLYDAEGSASADGRVRLVVSQASRFFGTTPESRAPWNPVTLAPAMHADVLLLHENDDAIVPPAHSALFQAARPTTQSVGLESGAGSFMHGTISDAGRGAYAAAIGAFADRAVAAREAESSAERLGCTNVDRTVVEVGLPRLQSALRCLARRDAEARRVGRGSWQSTSIKTRGEVNAARIWASLRGSLSGRRALLAAARRRAQITVKLGERSRITLRATS